MGEVVLPLPFYRVWGRMYFGCWFCRLAIPVGLWVSFIFEVMLQNRVSIALGDEHVLGHQSYLSIFVLKRYLTFLGFPTLKKLKSSLAAQ